MNEPGAAVPGFQNCKGGMGLGNYHVFRLLGYFCAWLLLDPAMLDVEVGELLL